MVRFLTLYPTHTHTHICGYVECYSEASDHEEAESTEIPPPPYSEQTLRNSVETPAPPGSTHQVSPYLWLPHCTTSHSIVASFCV